MIIHINKLSKWSIQEDVKYAHWKYSLTRDNAISNVVNVDMVDTSNTLSNGITVIKTVLMLTAHVCVIEGGA